MSSAFWQGFRDGYVQTSYKMLPIILALIAGWAFGQYFHPYERCDRTYNSPEDIAECVWLLRSK